MYRCHGPASLNVFELVRAEHAWFCAADCGLVWHRRYIKEDTSSGLIKPKRLPENVLGWIRPVYAAKLDNVIDVAGVDAAMYLRCIAFGEHAPPSVTYSYQVEEAG